MAPPRASPWRTAVSHLAHLRCAHSKRSLATRSDFTVQPKAPPRPSANSQLLSAIAPEPPEPEPAPASSTFSSLFSRSSGTPTSAPPRSRQPPSRRSGIDVLGQMAQRIPSGAAMRGSNPGAAVGGPGETMTRAELARKSKAIEYMQFRRWRAGDVYAPHDLSPEEMRKYNKPRTPRADVFDMLNINPLDEYKNLPLMMDFVTQIGRLKHQRLTGLRPVNQRKISRAYRRACALGLLPRTHAHPEMLRRPGPWQRKS